MKKKFLSKTQTKGLIVSDPVIAKAYGRPKIHKDGVPLRPIISLIGSPTYKLAKWLYQFLKPTIQHSNVSINSPVEFINGIKQISLNEDEMMVSFDVISLFSSIPTELALSCAKCLITKHPLSIPTDHIMELLTLCSKNYFQFNKAIYEQKKGTPMGSPISGFFAEAVMQRLEDYLFDIVKPKLYFRYVDDTFVIIKRTELEFFHNTLNSIYTDIQFTFEEEKSGELPFLDVLIKRLNNGKLQTSVYRKNSNSEVILHYASNHPANHKRSCVRTLFNRAHTHCSTTNNLKEEIDYLYKFFSNNGYPKSFVKNALRK